MKLLSYQCDYCEKKHANNAELSYLGTNEDNEFRLFYTNPNPGPNQMGSIGRMHDLHFCNQKCFVNYFFNNNLI
jgi:hypothetical protein